MLYWLFSKQEGYHDSWILKILIVQKGPAVFCFDTFTLMLALWSALQVLGFLIPFLTSLTEIR